MAFGWDVVQVLELQLAHANLDLHVGFYSNYVIIKSKRELATNTIMTNELKTKKTHKKTLIQVIFNFFTFIINNFSGRKMNCVLYGVLYGVDCLTKVHKC